RPRRLDDFQPRTHHRPLHAVYALLSRRCLGRICHVEQSGHRGFASLLDLRNAPSACSSLFSAWLMIEGTLHETAPVVVPAWRRYRQVLVRDNPTGDGAGHGSELWRALARRAPLDSYRGRSPPGLAVPVGGPDCHLPELRRNTILAHARDGRHYL